jgi:hypothetical protein
VPVEPPDRPLRLGEVFAETVRVYGERIWAALGLGLVTAVGFVVGLFVHPVVVAVVLSVAITACWAAATRILAGDDFGAAWRSVARHALPLLVFTFVATLPFALALSQLVLIVVAVAWLAATGFTIPVTVAEEPPEGLDFVHRLGYDLRRSIELARAEYFHAAGVIAALVILYLLLAVVLIGALRGFGENGDVAAVALAQIVLAPFFYLGLAVLYFDQRARAISSGRAI